HRPVETGPARRVEQRQGGGAEDDVGELAAEVEGGHVALHHRAPLAHRPGRAGQPGAEQPEHVVGQVECGDLASGGQQREGEPAGARGQIEYRAVTGGAHGADDVPDLEAVGGGEVVVEGGALVVVEAA